MSEVKRKVKKWRYEYGDGCWVDAFGKIRYDRVRHAVYLPELGWEWYHEWNVGLGATIDEELRDGRLQRPVERGDE